MRVIFSINFSIFILSIIDCAVLICSLAFFVNSSGTLANANYLAAVFWLAMVISDIPIGYVADRYGPKRVFLISIITRSIAFILFFFGENYFLLLSAGNFIAGTSVAFMSNAFLMQINLLQNKNLLKENNHHLVLNNFFYKTLGLLFGCILSYFVIYFSTLKYIWIISAILSLILFVTICLFWDSLQCSTQKSPISQLKLAFSNIMLCPVLKESIFTNALITIFSCALLNNWIIVFVPELEKTLNNLILAYMFFYFLRFATAIFWKKINQLQVMSLDKLMALFGVNIFILSSKIYLLQIAGFVFAIIILSAIEVQLKKNILENLKNRPSGTILSIYSLLENLAGTFALFCCGYFLNIISITTIWGTIGIMVTALFYLLKYRDYRSNRANLRHTITH